jgi:translation initiation factor IF-3
LHERRRNRGDRMVNVNREIRSREVRLIDPEGGQVGIVSLEEALRMAAEFGLDLVEVAPNSSPPVCRIMDYGKYKYQQAKKIKDAKKKQTVIQVKEVKLSPKTDEHDLEYKIAHVKRFLTEGNRAKITIQFRGREIAYPELSRRVIDSILASVEGLGVVEQEPKMEGRRMTLVLKPVSAGKH